MGKSSSKQSSSLQAKEFGGLFGLGSQGVQTGLGNVALQGIGSLLGVPAGQVSMQAQPQVAPLAQAGAPAGAPAQRFSATGSQGGGFETLLRQAPQQAVPQGPASVPVFQPGGGGGGGGTAFDLAIQQSALNPQGAKIGDIESALLDQAAAQANQRSTVRGLGAATGQTIGQQSAPLLAQLRQQQFQNLVGGQAGAQQQRAITQQGQQAGLGALLELAGMSMPQIVAGQQTKGGSSGFNLK